MAKTADILHNKGDGEALAETTEGNTGAISGESENTDEQKAKANEILDKDRSLNFFKHTLNVIEESASPRNREIIAKRMGELLETVFTRLENRKNKGEISPEMHHQLFKRANDLWNETHNKVKEKIEGKKKPSKKSAEAKHEENTKNSKNTVDNKANAADNKGNGVVAKENENDSRQESEQHDGRGQEDLQRTSGRIQERPGGVKNNRSKREIPRTQNERTQGDDGSVLLTKEQEKSYENINPTIPTDEWRNVSKNLEGFSNALNTAIEDNERGGFVDPKSPEELKEHNAIVAMTTDEMAGVAVEDDGNIVAVFKNPNKKAKGAVNSIITMARAMGGTKMDCYGRGLLTMYERLGFKVVAKIPFTDAYIEKDDNGKAVNPKKQILLDERPDVYVLMTNGDDFATATKKIANNEYPISTQEELDALPVFANEETGYTDAQEYRDALLAGDTKKAEKIRSEKAEKTVKEETKAPQEKPQKTKAQQKADAEKDAKAKRLLTKDAYDKVYTPFVNVLEQAQPEVAKAARDTALLMAKTADILHKRFKMKWENAPRVLLGGNAEIGTGIYGHNVIIEDLDVDALPAELNVTEVKGDEFGEWKDIAELRKKALQYYTDNLQGEIVRNPILGEIIIDGNKDIEFTGSGKREAKNTGANPDKWLTVKYLREIIEKSNTVTDADIMEEKHKNEHFYYIHQSVQIGNRKKYVVVTVRRLNADKKDTLKYYNHTVFSEENYKKQLEKTSLPDGIRHNNHPSPQADEASSGSIVAKKRKVYKSRGNEFNQIAWHGSPYTFDMFDLSKIGSGEGAQVHGWGLYFARDEIVSRGYKSALQRDSRFVMVIDGKKYNQPDPIEREYVDENGDKVKRDSAVWWACYALRYGISFSESGDVVPEAKRALEKNLELFKHALKRGNTFGRTVEQTKEIIKGQEKALSIIKNGKADVILVNDSRLYKVDIPENDVLLDEQKSLSEQPSKVREAFHTYLGGNYNSYQSASGRELYEIALVNKFWTRKK